VHFIRQGLETRYMIWPEEIQGIQSSVNDPERYEAKMKELKEADVLYIDDLFKHGKDEHTGKMRTPSEPEVRRAFEIINHRYNNQNKITIISGEWTLFELNDIDQALAGRIAENTKEQGFCINLRPDFNKNWRMKGLVEL
jgi:DNA replication protein DnaC